MFLKRLKKNNIKIAVASNKLENLTKIVIKKSKLNKYFKVIFELRIGYSNKVVKSVTMRFVEAI